MKVKNIDKKLEKELEITKPLREYPYRQEIDIELNKAWESKHGTQRRSKKLWGKFQKELTESNYKEFPVLKRLLDEVDAIYQKSQYLKFPFSKQTEDFAEAHVRLIYNDGNIVEPLSKNNYDGLVRKNMKSVSVISESGEALFTLDIINDKLIYRLRNTPPPIQRYEELAHLSHSNYDTMDFDNPKRCFILSTKGRTVFVWDSGEVVEITKWSEIRPYDKPNLRNDEK